MIDYRRRTYIVDKPYSEQMNYRVARPQTYVKQQTPRVNYESPVSYRPYESRSYNEMMHLFPGYEGIRKKWFDSRVGGQGEKLYKIVTSNLSSYVHVCENINVNSTWSAIVADPTAASIDGINGYYPYGYVSTAASVSSAGSGSDDFRCNRIIMSFSLKNIDLEDVDEVYFGCTYYPLILFGVRYATSGITIQESWHNTKVPPSDLSNYSKFKGAPFCLKAFIPGNNLFRFNQSGVNYIKRRLGKTIGLCIRDWYDFLGITPTAVSGTTDAPFNAFSVDTAKLYINHDNRVVGVKPAQSSEEIAGVGGFKLIPA